MKNVLVFITISLVLCGCSFDPSQFSVKERDAGFPGGKEMLSEYLSENLNYPQFAVENEIEGKVYVRFVVERDGAVSNVRVVKHAHESLDDEALRVVRKMPKWLPRIVKGKATPSYFNLPITFKLQ